jgi:hypothetical protein
MRWTGMPAARRPTIPTMRTAFSVGPVSGLPAATMSPRTRKNKTIRSAIRTSRSTSNKDRTLGERLRSTARLDLCPKITEHPQDADRGRHTAPELPISRRVVLRYRSDRRGPPVAICVRGYGPAARSHRVWSARSDVGAPDVPCSTPSRRSGEGSRDGASGLRDNSAPTSPRPSRPAQGEDRGRYRVAVGSLAHRSDP